jgi:hypothetical protein
MKWAKHFDIWEWVDYVRNTGDAARLSPMSDHLAAGCRRCERVVRVLSELARTAPLESRNAPSPQIVRLAEAIFPSRRPEHTLIGRLVYDSFREPLPAGMRSGVRLARHALYEAGDVFVDLQMEQAPAGPVTLVGQISDREAARTETPSRPVLLTSGRALVTSALCNRLGEFELTYQPARHLRLHVPLRETGGHIELRMDELAAVSNRGRKSTAAAKSQRRRE